MDTRVGAASGGFLVIIGSVSGHLHNGTGLAPIGTATILASQKALFGNGVPFSECLAGKARPKQDIDGHQDHVHGQEGIGQNQHDARSDGHNLEGMVGLGLGRPWTRLSTQIEIGPNNDLCQETFSQEKKEESTRERARETCTQTTTN